MIVVPNADASYNFEYLLKEIDEVVPINRGPVLLLLGISLLTVKN